MPRKQDKGGPIPGVVEAFYDPMGQYDNGRFSTQGIGGHSNHVHVSVTTPQAALTVIKLAQSMGLAVRENPFVDPVDPVHVTDSYHYKSFPGTYEGKALGQAVDVSGDPDTMAKYYRAVTGGGSQYSTTTATPDNTTAEPQNTTVERPQPTPASPVYTPPPGSATTVQPQVIGGNTTTDYTPDYDRRSRMIEDMWKTIAELPYSSSESQRFGSF